MTLLQDMRFAIRTLHKNPGYACIAAATLALGIGANTAMFSVVRGVLLNPLPYANPDRLVRLGHFNRENGVPYEAVAYETFRDLQEQGDWLARVGGVSPLWTLTLRTDRGAERVSAHWVSSSLFEVLGVSARHGRTFQTRDDELDQPAVAVLSHEFWSREFGGRDSIVGEAITLNGMPVTVVGVMPAGFEVLDPVDVYAPLSRNPIIGRGRPVRFVDMVGELREDVSLEEARAEYERFCATLEEAYPEANAGLAASVRPLHDVVVGEVRPALWALFAGVGFVLLIAAANVANLMLARASERRQELAVRCSLGASRWRLVRQLLTESAILHIIGGVGGMLVAFWGLEALRSGALSRLPRAEEIVVDWWVLAFTISVALLTGLAFGLVPAAQTFRVNLNDALKQGMRSVLGREGGRTRRVLVVSELALSLVLLCGAGLMMRSFHALMSVDPGFEPANLLTLQVMVPGEYTAEQRQGFFDTVFDELAALPGVEVAGATTRMPLGNGVTTELEIEGDDTPQGQRPEVEFRRISNDYCRAMGIALLSGRMFGDEDRADSAPVVIINESAAKRLWPGEDPVGRNIRFFGSGSAWFEIVGVIEDVRHFGLDAGARPEVCISVHQGPPTNPLLALRTSIDPLDAAPAVRARLREIEPDLLIYNVRPMTELVSNSVATRRLSMGLMSGFAAIALALAAIGIYGVISVVVGQRRLEFGIRLALGAQRLDVLGLVLKESGTLMVIGLVVGLALALGLTRLMDALLFQVSPNDLAVYLFGAGLMMIVALAAAYIPARRATRVDPMQALRSE